MANENSIDEEKLGNHIQQFKGFWGYMSGYNQNRKNYYEVEEEASTAVATRIVHENLPIFCSNILRFEKHREEYLSVYQYLKDNNIETKIKNVAGTEIEAEAISQSVFQIEHFNKCLAQSQIEEYNRIIGNCNSLINLYNQAHRDNTLDEFEKLKKQIGCGKKKSMFAALIKDRQCELTVEQKKKENEEGAILTVETLLKKAEEAGNRVFKNNDENDGEITTIPDFIQFLQRCNNWSGIYMSKAAISKISSLYFADWHSIEEKFIEWHERGNKEQKEKAKACSTYDKKREDPLKLLDAVELSGFFEALDTVQPEHFFKEWLFKNDETNEYLGKLNNKLSSSRNLINLLCCDIERNTKKFQESASEIVKTGKCKDEANEAGEKDQTIKSIKEWFDEATDAMRIVRYFAVRRSKMKGSLPNIIMERALSNLLYNDDDQWFKWYDLIRNYLTKKPQDDVKDAKLKLNFDSSSFFKESGWDNDYSKNGAFIVIMDNNYYLVVIKDKLEEDDLNKIKTSQVSNAKRVIYNYQKMDFKNFPRWFIMSTGNTIAKAVKDYKLPVDTILDEYKQYRQRTTNDKKQYMDNHPEFLIKLIDYYKKCAPLHKSLAPFKDRLEAVWRKTEEYTSLSDFYNDTLNVCYDIKFENINFEELRTNDKFYLFRICNKDFSTGKNGGNGSTGKENLHTIYWKMLFDESNLKDVFLKLDGQGGELFMRKPVAKESPVKHKVGSKLVNKRDIDGNTIPEKIYREIYSYVNAKDNDHKKNISDKAKKYIEEQKAIIKDVRHEIVKDNRFYGETRYLFHCPITINFKAKTYKNPKYAFPEVNEKITNALQQSEKLQFIGIDRGEKHLVYSCTIDKDSKIIKCQPHDSIKGTDYVKKLEAVADERIVAKKNWQAQNKIKDLKSGYISHVVHSLVEEAIKSDGVIDPHAYIILEDLSTEMKRGRQKFEKQVYQNLEVALAKKLNFVVDKDAKPGELGSVSKALQLTPPISNYQDIEGKKQFGIMLYTRANYTSITDPATGWRKTIYIKDGKEEEIKNQFLKAFKDFGFDGKDYYFKYTDTNTEKEWCMYSGKDGKPLPRFQNKKQKSEGKISWVTEPVYVVEILDKLFANFDKAKSFKEQIEQGVELMKYDDKNAWQSLRYALNIIQQIRNSGKKESDDNFLFSPVRNEKGEHFDTHKYESNGDLSEIRDADANGAYNIARKGLIMDAHIKYWIKKGCPEISKDGKKHPDLDLFISDREWDLWLLKGKEQWTKELPSFALISAKEGTTPSKGKNNRKKKQ